MINAIAEAHTVLMFQEHGENIKIKEVQAQLLMRGPRKVFGLLYQDGHSALGLVPVATIPKEHEFMQSLSSL